MHKFTKYSSPSIPLLFNHQLSEHSVIPTVEMTVLLEYLNGVLYINEQASIIKTHDSVVRPKKPAHHTVSILTGRKKMQFSHLCSFVIPYPIGTKFSGDVPPS